MIKKTCSIFACLILIPIYALASNLSTHKNVVIIGGGHAGLVEAYGIYKRAQKNNEDVRIRIIEKNANIHHTTAANIWKSHTPDEIISVVPRGHELANKLNDKKT